MDPVDRLTPGARAVSSVRVAALPRSPPGPAEVSQGAVGSVGCGPVACTGYPPESPRRGKPPVSRRGGGSGHCGGDDGGCAGSVGCPLVSRTRQDDVQRRPTAGSAHSGGGISGVCGAAVRLVCHASVRVALVACVAWVVGVACVACVAWAVGQAPVVRGPGAG
jgi:hypothetical protein